jgi:hypothetical protein
LKCNNAERTQRFPEASFFLVNRCGNRLPYCNILPYLRADDPLASMDEALARFLKAHPDTTVA